MFILYLLIIILNILVISSLFIKAKFQIKYETVDVNTIKRYITISILNFDIYKQKKEIAINSVINKYIKKGTQKNDNIILNKKIYTFKEIVQEVSKEKVTASIYIGVNDSTLPIYIIPTFATALSIYLVNNIKEKYVKNITYNLYPNYIRTYILIDIIINFRLLSLIKVFYLKNKYEEERNGKSSN